MTMIKVVDILNQNTSNNMITTKLPPNSQPLYGHIGTPEDYGDMRSGGGGGGVWQQNNDINDWKQQQMIQDMNHMNLGVNHSHIIGAPLQQQIPQQLQQPIPPPIQQQMQQQLQQQIQQQPTYGHHRTSSATNNNQVMVPQTQPLPQAPLQTTAAPPPPPPPPPPPGPIGGTPSISQMPSTNRLVSNTISNSTPNGPQSGGPLNLAAAIATAKLKRTLSSGAKEETITVETTTVRAAAPNNLMDEMAKTLARRRAQAEGSQNTGFEQYDSSNQVNDQTRKQWDGKHSANGSSPCKDTNTEASNIQRFYSIFLNQLIIQY